MEEAQLQNLSSSMKQLTKQIEKNNAALLLSYKETDNIDKKFKDIGKQNKELGKSWKNQKVTLKGMAMELAGMYGSLFKMSKLMASVASGGFAVNFIKDAIDLDNTMTRISVQMGKGGKDVKTLENNFTSFGQKAKDSVDKVTGSMKNFAKEHVKVSKVDTFDEIKDGAYKLNGTVSTASEQIRNMSSLIESIPSEPEKWGEQTVNTLNEINVRSRIMRESLSKNIPEGEYGKGTLKSIKNIEKASESLNKTLKDMPEVGSENFGKDMSKKIEDINKDLTKMAININNIPTEKELHIDTKSTMVEIGNIGKIIKKNNYIPYHADMKEVEKALGNSRLFQRKLTFMVDKKEVEKNIREGNYNAPLKLKAVTDEELKKMTQEGLDSKLFVSVSKKNLKHLKKQVDSAAGGKKVVTIDANAKDLEKQLNNSNIKLKLDGDVDNLKKQINKQSIRTNVRFNIEDEGELNKRINDAMNTKQAISNVEYLKNSVTSLQQEYGTAYEDAKMYVTELAQNKFAGDIRDAAAGVDLFSRSTSVAGEQVVELTNNLSKQGGLSTGAINSMYAGMVKIQQQVGISKKGMTALVSTIADMSSNMAAFGKSSEDIKRMATQTTALVGSLEQVGVSAERSTQMINQLTDPDKIEDNILLYSQLGISMEDAMSGNFDLSNFDGQLKDMAQRIVDMGPIAGSSFAKSMGMTYKEAQKMTNMEEGAMDAMGEAAKTTEEQSLDTLKELMKNTEGFGKKAESFLNKVEGWLRSAPKSFLIGALLVAPLLKNLFGKIFSRKKIQASVTGGMEDASKKIKSGIGPAAAQGAKKMGDKVGKAMEDAGKRGAEAAEEFASKTGSKLDKLIAKAKKEPLGDKFLSASKSNLNSVLEKQIADADAEMESVIAKAKSIGAEVTYSDKGPKLEHKKEETTAEKKAIDEANKLLERQKAIRQGLVAEQAEANKLEGGSTENAINANTVYQNILKRKEKVSNIDKEAAKIVADKAKKEKELKDIETTLAKIQKDASKNEEEANKNLKKARKDLANLGQNADKKAIKAAEDLVKKREEELQEQKNLIAMTEAQKELNESELKDMNKKLADLEEEKNDLNDIKKIKADIAKTGATGIEGKTREELEKAAKEKSLEKNEEKPEAKKPQNAFGKMKEGIKNKAKASIAKRDWGKAAAAEFKKDGGNKKNIYIKHAIFGAAKSLGKGFAKVGTGIVKGIGKGLGGLAKGVGGILKTVGPVAIVAGVFGRLMDAFKQPMENMMDIISGCLAPIIDALMPIMVDIMNLVATKLLPPMLEALAGIIDLLHWILKPVNAILKGLGSIIPGSVGEALKSTAQVLEDITDKDVTNSLRDAAALLRETPMDFESCIKKEEDLIDQESDALEEEESPEVMGVSEDNTYKVIAEERENMKEQTVSPSNTTAKNEGEIAKEAFDKKEKEEALLKYQGGVIDYFGMTTKNIIIIRQLEEENSKKKVADVFQASPEGMTVSTPSAT